MTLTEIHRSASGIAGALWDDRAKVGSLADQLRAVAATPAAGTDGDLTGSDRRALRVLADDVEATAA